MSRNHRTILTVGSLILLLFIFGCGNGSSGSSRTHSGSSNDNKADPAEPAFDVSLFNADSAQITNQYLPLPAGKSIVLEGETDEGGTERVEIFVSHLTKEILGVTCAIVVDRVYEDGDLIEETFDWFAQDTEGNVWYLGEDSAEYEDGEVVSTAGSWEAGVDGAVAGIIFKADPQVGDSYQQEYYEDEAEDMAEVVALNVTATLTDGTVYDDCVKTREWTRLLPGVEEFKYYAPDVGLVLVELDGEPVEELVSIGIDTEPEIDPENFADSTDIDNPYMPLTPGTTYDYEGETEDGTETTEVFVSDDTKVILGVTCVVVEDRVYLDGELIEETFDWYAQDNEGNVWYFGEDSAEYEDGEIVSTAGSWEAGVDGAQPGIIMKADPRVGDSYRQEYYEGEAEDLAAVLALEQSVSVPYGDFDECLQTLDWAPLVANSNEYKYYAPGIGMVLESKEDGSEPVELISITD